jgi:hypothetical protein
MDSQARCEPPKSHQYPSRRPVSDAKATASASAIDHGAAITLAPDARKLVLNAIPLQTGIGCGVLTGHRHRRTVRSGGLKPGHACGAQAVTRPVLIPPKDRDSRAKFLQLILSATVACNRRQAGFTPVCLRMNTVAERSPLPVLRMTRRRSCHSERSTFSKQLSPIHSQPRDTL